MMRTIEVNQIINREKLSPLQWLVFILGFLVFFCDGLDTGIIGFIAPALLDDWGISKPQLAPVLSAALVVMSIGAIISGPLSDKFGRKGIVVITTLLFSVFTILCGFANADTNGGRYPGDPVTQPVKRIQLHSCTISFAGCASMSGISTTCPASKKICPLSPGLARNTCSVTPFVVP